MYSGEYDARDVTQSNITSIIFTWVHNTNTEKKIVIKKVIKSFIQPAPDEQSKLWQLGELSYSWSKGKHVNGEAGYGVELLCEFKFRKRQFLQLFERRIKVRKVCFKTFFSRY
jgi:hypothetical protein